MFLANQAIYWYYFVSRLYKTQILVDLEAQTQNNNNNIPYQREQLKDLWVGASMWHLSKCVGELLLLWLIPIETIEIRIS